jgi:hypothetical protein
MALFFNIDRYTEFFDDFLGDVVADQWSTHVGSDPDCAAAAIVAAKKGGVCRLTFGNDAGVSMALNGSQLDAGVLNWSADQGSLSIAGRIRLNTDVDNAAIFFGLTDQVAALEMPYSISGSSYTSNATDAVGVLYDVGATSRTWRLVGVKADTDVTQDSTLIPAPDTFETWEIKLSSAGAATFYRNGFQVGSKMTSAITASTLLTPCFAGFTRTAAIRSADIEYVHIRASRV